MSSSMTSSVSDQCHHSGWVFTICMEWQMCAKQCWAPLLCLLRGHPCPPWTTRGWHSGTMGTDPNTRTSQLPYSAPTTAWCAGSTSATPPSPASGYLWPCSTSSSGWVLFFPLPSLVIILLGFEAEILDYWEKLSLFCYWQCVCLWFPFQDSGTRLTEIQFCNFFVFWFILCPGSTEVV